MLSTSAHAPCICRHVLALTFIAQFIATPQASLIAQHLRKPAASDSVRDSADAGDNVTVQAVHAVQQQQQQQHQQPNNDADDSITSAFSSVAPCLVTKTDASQDGYSFLVLLVWVPLAIDVVNPEAQQQQQAATTAVPADDASASRETAAATAGSAAASLTPGASDDSAALTNPAANDDHISGRRENPDSHFSLCPVLASALSCHHTLLHGVT
jgi:hypothetical protein